MTARVDDDRSRPLVRRVGDDLAGENGIRPSRLFPWCKNAGIGRPTCAGYHCEQQGACCTPYDPHLPRGPSREPDLHSDILNQKRVRGTTLGFNGGYEAFLPGARFQSCFC